MRPSATGMELFFFYLLTSIIKDSEQGKEKFWGLVNLNKKPYTLLNKSPVPKNIWAGFIILSLPLITVPFFSKINCRSYVLIQM